MYPTLFLPNRAPIVATHPHRFLLVPLFICCLVSCHPLLWPRYPSFLHPWLLLAAVGSVGDVIATIASGDVTTLEEKKHSRRHPD